MSTSFKWNKAIAEVKEICAGVGIPMSVETDNNLTGAVDGQINLGDITFETIGNTVNNDFPINIQLSTPKANYIEIIEKMELLTQKFGYNSKALLGGWILSPDDSKIIYNCIITYTGIISGMDSE